MRLRLGLLWRYLRIDWFVEHAHKPIEVARLTADTLRRGGGDAIVEAGCWQGGSTAKLSILADVLGVRLHTFDSFQGVENVGREEGSGYDFSGEYTSTIGIVRSHVARYGVADVLTLHPGWFSDTVCPEAVGSQVGVVFIDCDLAKGTGEVLAGLAPALADDALVYSQDWQVPPVRALLDDTTTWRKIGLMPAKPEFVGGHTVRMRVNRE